MSILHPVGWRERGSEKAVSVAPSTVAERRLAVALEEDDTAVTTVRYAPNTRSDKLGLRSS